MSDTPNIRRARARDIARMLEILVERELAVIQDDVTRWIGALETCGPLDLDGGVHADAGAQRVKERRRRVSQIERGA